VAYRPNTSIFLFQFKSPHQAVVAIISSDVACITKTACVIITADKHTGETHWLEREGQTLCLEAVSKLNFHYERLQFPLAVLSAQNSSST
jgi:hypothetical protein